MKPSQAAMLAERVVEEQGGRRLAPVPDPLPPELLPVEAFPMKALPAAFAPIVEDIAERISCPPDFIAVPMLIAAGSLIARHVGLRPQAQTDWIERPNLWGLIVARPGFMKSPALSAALAPMERLESRALEAHGFDLASHRRTVAGDKLRAEARVKAARVALKADPDADIGDLVDEDEAPAPPRRRYIANDVTYEACGEILTANPNGVLVVRDEMRGFLTHLGDEKQAQARGFFIQAWSGGRYNFDRIGRGAVPIEDLRLSLIGGIQPGPLCDLILQAKRSGAADDGMLERFLIAWPDHKGEWVEVDRPPSPAAKAAAWGAFERLDKLSATDLRASRDTDFTGKPSGLPYLRFDAEALAVFREWRVAFERRLRDPESEGFESVLTKFRHHVPALALAMHVIDGKAGPVSAAATTKALALGEYFESHARRLHGSGRRSAVRAARALLSKVQQGALGDPFTAREVYRPAWSGLADKTAVVDALDLLVSHGWLVESTMDTGGRPTVVYSLAAGARRG